MAAKLAFPFIVLLIFIVASVGEIAGSFAFWSWARLGKSMWWLVPGTVSLIAFAYALTFTPSDFAGRAFAAYGGVFIASSLAWLWLVERQQPDRWDIIGGLICIAGAAVILLGPRPA